MRPEYDGVKFYSMHDWGIGEHLAKAAIAMICILCPLPLYQEALVYRQSHWMTDD